MSTLRLKQIERGNVTFTGADITKTITLATTLISTAKTILLFTARSTSDACINYQVLGRVLSTTQVRFERTATPSIDCIVEYQVVEFTSGITVQHLYITQSSTTLDTVITAVTLAKTFPLLSMTVNGNTFDGSDGITADITTTTNLQTKVFTLSVPNCPVAVQIVEIDDSSVQRISGTYGAGSTKDISITSITESKTFWFFGFTTSAPFFLNSIPYLSYVNSTTLRFTRGNGTVDIPFIAYVVSLSSGITVQNISTVIASSGSSVSPTISPIITDNTVLFVNGMYQRFMASNEPSDDAGSCMVTLSGLSSTGFTATRSDTPALAATANVQILSFIKNNWFLLANKNEVLNIQNVNGMR